jgi:hypothetical protein
MAQDEHRMVFDIRGRRRHVVKAVYAILAILMAASLFLVTGIFNPNTLFGSGSSGESVSKTFEKQAETIEAKLTKTPGDEALMANLTRARINAANAMYKNAVENQSQSEAEEARHQFALASEDWSKYLETVKEPSAGLAIQVAPALFQLAELSPNGEAALENVKAATEAEQIVTDKRNDLNSWSTLATYALFAQNYKLAEEAKEEVAKQAGTKFERESFENRYDEIEKNAKEFGKRLKLEKASQAQGGNGGKESLENPIQGLSGGGATGLGG